LLKVKFVIGKLRVEW